MVAIPMIKSHASDVMSIVKKYTDCLIIQYYWVGGIYFVMRGTHIVMCLCI